MSEQKTVVINKIGHPREIFHTTLGNIIKNRSYRGASFTDSEIIDIAKQGIQLGWISLDWFESRFKKDIETLEEKIKDMRSVCVDFQQAHIDDSALAGLYLYKLESCKERLIPWELSLSDMRRIIKRTKCYYSGLNIERDGKSRNRMTLDRIDSSKGYTKENTVPCCFWVNQLKCELFENPSSRYLTDKKTLLKILSKID